MGSSFRQVIHDTEKSPDMRPSKCADALAHAETEASRANGAVRAAEGRRMDARRRFAAFHRTNMSRSRVLQGLLLYLVSQTKESPPFSLYCFSPYKAVAAPRCRTSPSLWPGGAPLSPGRSVSRTRTRPLPHHRPTRIIVEHVTSGRCRFEAMSFANLSLARFLRRGAYRKTSFPDSFDPC